MTYRKAIIAAIEEMGDNHLRSNIEAIEKHVKANLPKNMEWNHVLFLTTLKAIIEDGAVDVLSNSFSLSPEFKKQRIRSIRAKLQQCPYPPMISSLDDIDSPAILNEEHLKYRAAKRKVYRNENDTAMKTG